MDNEGIELYKRVLHNNFVKVNDRIVNIRSMNKVQLFFFLKQKGFRNLGVKLFKCNIDGLDFISIMSEKDLQEILEESENSEDLEKLKRFYFTLHTYRRAFCEDYQEDEIPFYSYDG